jgi:hypothetical protein
VDLPAAPRPKITTRRVVREFFTEEMPIPAARAAQPEAPCAISRHRYFFAASTIKHAVLTRATSAQATWRYQLSVSSTPAPATPPSTKQADTLTWVPSLIGGRARDDARVLGRLRSPTGG